MSGQDKVRYSNEKLEVLIFGAGLVGCFASIYFASKGHKVKIYEKKTDPRTWSEEDARSINLTLSTRGKRALAQVDLESFIVEHGVEVYGRTVHDLNGNLKHSLYNEMGEGIVSLKRTHLNCLLINKVLAYPNIEVFFCHELIKCDSRTGEATLKVTDGNMTKEMSVTADLIVGADGAHSVVRDQIFKEHRLTYFEQKYQDQVYMELIINANEDGKHQMDQGRIHIWPRGELVLVGLPNKDGTFSGTLFMSSSKFDEIIENEAAFLQFFRNTISDLVPLIGENNLTLLYKAWKGRRPGRLISNKCQPYHAGDKVVIIGDAAHAMVPFFGQGMNTGFEDCYILAQLLDKHGHKKESLGQALKEYSEKRCKDGHAICEMALKHYKEVVFSQRSYHECQLRAKRQDQIITQAVCFLFSAFFGVSLAVLWKMLC